MNTFYLANIHICRWEKQKVFKNLKLKRNYIVTDMGTTESRVWEGEGVQNEALVCVILKVRGEIAA